MTTAYPSAVLTLYHALECPFAARVRMALAEKSLKYKSVLVDLSDILPKVNELNPNGEIPILELESGDHKSGLSNVIYESSVILEYLDEEHPSPVLRPKSPQARAQLRLFQCFLDEGFLDSLYVLRWNPGSRAAESADLQWRQGVQRLSAGLGNREYLFNHFGLAEILIAPWVVTLESNHPMFTALPENVRNWIERVRVRPSVAADAILHPEDWAEQLARAG